MLIGRFLLIIIIMLWTFIFDVITIEDKNEQSKLIVIPTNLLLLYNQIECQEACSNNYCLKYTFLHKNCTKLIRDQCDCCTVCLRNESEICGGKFHVYGICTQDLFCYKSNKTTKNLSEQTGICVKACLKFQCLSIIKNNKTICECINRNVPCDENFEYNIQDNCNNQTDLEQEHDSSSLKTTNTKELIDCSNVICNNTSICSSDSRFVEDHTPLLQTSLSQSTDLSSICCKSRGHCVCSSCPEIMCGENSIIQIYRTGNPNIPGQCCTQFNCIKNSQQCHHDKKIYNENETWSIDHCTTCTCRDGHADCAMIQCPIYTHCGYMYKPENECCPKCGGCLNDRFHVQHMNSTWIESNGCMRCWCENGRSRCIAEGCIAPPCENPRQIANVCCPVCDDDDDDDENKGQYSQDLDTITQSIIQTSIYKCPILNNCLLVCEHGLTKDEHGCFQCACSTMSCPTPLCTLKFDKLSKQYCLCKPPLNTNCQQFYCDKHCPYSYSIDKKTGCPYCACNSCPQLICKKNCTYGLKKNDVGCPICVCESNFTLNTEVILHTWPRQCLSDKFSYSNGEIWFDGCRQCLCHKGEQLCALISCPTPKCSQPIILPNRCCPSCPDIPMLPEPIPSSQVCYASQYVTGEELEFDKCTKCICLHNIAFCSISLCPPFPCSSPIYDSSLCCPICPITSEFSSIIDLSSTNEDICILDNGIIKNAGELWKTNDCQSCLCPRDGTGQIKCFSQICNQQLSCSNPVLKKGQCCPFCLPPTAAVAVCIFNFVQYRSGEHWNVSECHHCECSLGTIVCHQQKCPTLTCLHTVTLSGHCCPICRDQLYFSNDQEKLPISPSRFGFSIIIIFSILILILVLIIIILIFILLKSGRRSISSSNQLSNVNQYSPKLSHHPTIINSKSSSMFSYQYDLMLIPNDMKNTKQKLSSSSNIPLTSTEQTSTHSILGTNTTGTNSINNELEPITWNEDDTLILHCSTSSNDGDYEHEVISTGNEESHQQQSSQQQYQMITGPPTIIYV
ncbi:unnamed protein product [Rotaria sp. Silwood1]|nr:unnamed protein product [Rotaria sp. Silwood1]CAF4554491.1 unnamed protein product [Rotaria sp. Silwood1]